MRSLIIASFWTFLYNMQDDSFAMGKPAFHILRDNFLKIPEYPSGEVTFPRIISLTRGKRSSSSTQQGKGVRKKLLVIRSSNDTFYVHLTPNKDLQGKNFTMAIRGNISVHLPDAGKEEECHFHGTVLSHPQSYAALSICGNDKQASGVIITGNDAFVLRPLALGVHEWASSAPTTPGSSNDVIPHMIYRLKNEPQHFCGLELKSKTPYHENISETSEEEIKGRYRRADSKGRKVIETAVYVDQYLLKKFHNDNQSDSVSKLKSAVLAIVNEVQIIYNYRSLRTKFKIVVVKLEILSEGKDAPDTADGDIDRYLDNFCEWQSTQNPPSSSNGHWDHALMLTGLNLFKTTGRNRRNEKVLGLAWVNGMCRPQHSCTLNEGSSFEAAFVIAHEMGHSLGMLHDGRGNNCDPNKYLMSEKTGPGKITWSSCSNIYLSKFFQKGYGSCLEDDNTPSSPSLNHEADGRRPGQRFTLADQCKLSLGDNFKPHLTSKEPFNNVCRELWCVSGLWASVAHPALEGSSCGTGRQCIQGSCVRISAKARASANVAVAADDMKRVLSDFLDRLTTAFKHLRS